MARVRKLARRVVSGGALLSEEPEWRKVQVRIIGVLSFFAICFLLLAHGKFSRMWGAAPVYGAEAAFVLAVVALSVRGILKRRSPQPEPQDEEIELPPSIVEEQLASGALRPRDLVFERGIWSTLGESQQFSLAADAPVARERARERAVLLVQIALGLTLALAAGLLFINFFEVIRWLSSD